jgi:DNA-binding transcriptional ArsR family regulator
MTSQPLPADMALLEQAASMIRVLGHPMRLRIVACLEHGERTVSSLQEDLGVPQAIVSQQLAKMKAAKILKCRREGTNVWYAVADPRMIRMLECISTL